MASHLQIGMPQTMFEATREFLEDLECCVCKHVLRNPLLCKKGHQFCKNCITEWIKNKVPDKKPTCPGCRAEIPDDVDGLTVPLSMRNIINKITAKCTNGDDTESVCTWTGPYGNIAAHDRSCLHKMVHCKRCNEDMPRGHLENHMGICPKVPVQCSACSTTMERGKLTKHTKFLCGDENVCCPLNCGETVLRKGMVQHTLTCRKYMQTCPVPGCREILNDIATHNEEMQSEHTPLLLNAMMQPNKVIQVNGMAHGFTWTVTDTTITSKSAPMQTRSHEWVLYVLPTDRHNRKHLGLYAQMIRGHPTIVALRLKLTYKNIVKHLSSQMFMQTGTIKGWENALLDEEMDQEDQASNLAIDLIIQNF